MEVIDRLTKKVQLASDELIEAKRTNRRLSSELDALRHQLREHLLVVKENERYRRDLEKLRGRLTRLHKKVEKALMISPNALIDGQEENHEERPQ